MSINLHFTKPSLSRSLCIRCQAETIHRYNVCIHCGSTHEAYRSSELTFSRAVHVTPRRKRA